jgi:hypothetical protein
MWQVFRDKLIGAKRSAVIWFNGLMGVALIGLPVLEENLPQLQGIIPDQWYKYIMGAVIVANILLRFKTKLALENK